MPTYDEQAMQVLEEAERLKLNCQHEESIELLEGLLSHDPANVAALEELADNELSLERFDRAVKAAKQAVALDNESYIGHYILGFSHALESEWEQAEEELKLANKIRPDNAEILRCLGRVLYQNGENVQGIVTLERSLNLDNENVLTLCDLGECYLMSRNLQKAESLFKRTLEIEPLNERAQKCLEAMGKKQRTRGKRARR